MRANPHHRISEDFVAEIDKFETRCTVEDIVSQLKEQISGDVKLNFLMVCKPSPEAMIDGQCHPEVPGARQFCVGVVFAESTPETSSLAGMGRTVHVSDLGDRFAVSFMDAAPTRPPGNARSLIQRLFA